MKMIKKEKNKEGKKIKIRSSQRKKTRSLKGSMTLKGIEKKKQTDKKIQNLIAVLIFVSGLFVGSLFIDVVQLVTKNGYSERALRDKEVFELGDKTWVAYNEPAIKVDILISGDENCLACNADDVLIWMKKFIPTMAIHKVEENTTEGKILIEKYNLKTVPSFVFDSRIQEAEFYQEEQIQEIFDKEGDGLVLNSAALGIPAGKYIEAPGDLSGDIFIGNREAEVKLTTFIDFQSSYSKIFYEAVKEARKEFNADQLVLVYKFFPSDFQGQAISAALAGECAYQQGRFEEMADMIFDNQKEWAITEDFKIFDRYASVIGLNQNDFEECVISEDSQNLIDELIEQGGDFGIAATPASFIGNEFLNGIFQKNDIVDLVNEKLGISDAEIE